MRSLRRAAMSHSEIRLEGKNQIATGNAVMVISLDMRNGEAWSAQRDSNPRPSA
jgi:hypothetical protein